LISVSAISGLPTSLTLARLLPGGAVDGSFGTGGVLRLGAQAAPLGIAFGTGNAIYMWGSPCCEGTQPFLHRVSAKGLIDAQFDATADRTLANVGARGALDYRNAVLVVRPHGMLDLYGGDGLLRLRANGKAETKFGQGGVRALAETIIAATLVGNGKILGLGSFSEEGVSLVRLEENGRPDQSFGIEGERLVEGVYEGEGLTLARLNGRRAQVIDLGAGFCRYSCTSSPTLIRYRIGPKG
jgi:hypothetical protein